MISYAIGISRREIQIIILEAVTICSIAGCGMADTGEENAVPAVSDEEIPKDESMDQESEIDDAEPEAEKGASSGQTVYEKDFGTYTLASQWEETQEDDMFVYYEAGTEDSGYADTIALGCYESSYSLDEIDTVYYGIEAQLEQMLEENGGGDLADGIFSREQGYDLLIFGFEAGDADVTQFYIMGEKKHCVIQTITYGESEERNQVIQDMVNSFT